MTRIDEIITKPPPPTDGIGTRLPAKNEGALARWLRKGNDNPCRTRLFFADGGWAVKQNTTTWDIIVEVDDAGTVDYQARGVGWVHVAEHMAIHGLAERLTGESTGSDDEGNYYPRSNDDDD